MDDEFQKKTRKLFDSLTSASGEARAETRGEAIAGAMLDHVQKAYQDAAARRSLALDAEAVAREALAVHLGLSRP